MHIIKAYRPILYVIIIHNLMYYSNKCQFLCTCEQLAGGKRGGMVCMWVIYTETCKQWWPWCNGRSNKNLHKDNW